MFTATKNVGFKKIAYGSDIITSPEGLVNDEEQSQCQNPLYSS